MRALAVASLFLFSACSSVQPELVTVRHRVVMPDESMMQCSVTSDFPDPARLTDMQVARLLLQLYQDNAQCKNSMDAVRKFLEDARVQVEEGREPSSQSTPPQRRRPIR